MTKAFVMLNAERVEPGPLVAIAGAVQQETRLYMRGECVCVLLVTYPQGSPEWERWQASRTLDTATGIRPDSIQSDVGRSGS